MKLKIAINIAGILILLLFVACESYDSDYIPNDFRGMEVYVYNNNTKVEVHAGYVDGNYFSREKTLRKCQSFAHSFAGQNHLENWSYICCTVTSSSSCATKVK